MGWGERGGSEEDYLSEASLGGGGGLHPLSRCIFHSPTPSHHHPLTLCSSMLPSLTPEPTHRPHHHHPPPHTLPAAPLLRAHTTPLYQSQQSQLNARLQTTESQNATLVEEVRRQRAEIEDWLRLAETLVGDLEAAGRGLGEEGEELARKGREAEGVLDGMEGS